MEACPFSHHVDINDKSSQLQQSLAVWTRVRQGSAERSFSQKNLKTTFIDCIVHQHASFFQFIVMVTCIYLFTVQPSLAFQYLYILSTVQTLHQCCIYIRGKTLQGANKYSRLILKFNNQDAGIYLYRRSRRGCDRMVV